MVNGKNVLGIRCANFSYEGINVKKINVKKLKNNIKNKKSFYLAVKYSQTN